MPHRSVASPVSTTNHDGPCRRPSTPNRLPVPCSPLSVSYRLPASSLVAPRPTYRHHPAPTTPCRRFSSHLAIRAPAQIDTPIRISPSRARSTIHSMPPRVTPTRQVPPSLPGVTSRQFDLPFTRLTPPTPQRLGMPYRGTSTPRLLDAPCRSASRLRD